MNTSTLTSNDWIPLLLTVYATSAGALFAVLVTLWTDKRLVYQKTHFIISFLFSILALIAIVLSALPSFFMNTTELSMPFEIASILSFVTSLVILCIGMIHSNMVLRIFRVSRFIQGYVPAWLKLNTSKTNYISTQNDRLMDSYFGLPLSKPTLNMLAKGSSILIIFDCHGQAQGNDLLQGFLLSRLRSSETLDYVTTDRHPYLITDQLTLWARKLNLDLSKIASDDVVIIDAYTPLYGFNEDIQHVKRASASLQAKLLPATNLASIHSAAIRAWYIHKYRQIKSSGRLMRRPHTMVYDHISSLSIREDIDEIVRFIRHIASSERAYGMITVFIEYEDTPDIIKNAIAQVVDTVLLYQATTLPNAFRTVKTPAYIESLILNSTDIPIVQHQIQEDSNGVKCSQH